MGYSEEEFINVIDSIAGTITETHEYELRCRLLDFVGELESIIYLVEKKMIREKFLEQIIQLEVFLAE